MLRLASESEGFATPLRLDRVQDVSDTRARELFLLTTKSEKTMQKALIKAVRATFFL
jgi:hypothetical protein